MDGILALIVIISVIYLILWIIILEINTEPQ